MLKRVLSFGLASSGQLRQAKSCSNKIVKYSTDSHGRYEVKERYPLPTRPTTYKKEELTDVVESTEDFKFVERLIPSQIVPEPPKHESYPTPSGWVPQDLKKCENLSYYVMRTRFHQFPMYVVEREGGSRKLVRIKNIEGDIWVRNFVLSFVDNFCTKFLLFLS